MPHERAEEAPAVQTDLLSRAKSWQHYYEYFHKLDADMQHTTDVATQRRSAPAALMGATIGAVARAPSAEEKQSFEIIAEGIRARDRTLVHIEDDENGAARLSAEVSGIPGGRTLTNDDLRLVRAQLRAAAHSSNMRALEQEQHNARHLLHQRGGGGGGGDADGARRQKGAAAAAAHGRSKPPCVIEPPSDATTCAAAIETLLWFGMALGETNRKNGGGGGGAGGSSMSASAALAGLARADGRGVGGPMGGGRVSSFVDLEQLSRCFDEHEADPSSSVVPSGSVHGGTAFEEMSFATWDWVAAISETPGLDGDDAGPQAAAASAAPGELAAASGAAAAARPAGAPSPPPTDAAATSDAAASEDADDDAAKSIASGAEGAPPSSAASTTGFERFDSEDGSPSEGCNDSESARNSESGSQCGDDPPAAAADAAAAASAVTTRPASISVEVAASQPPALSPMHSVLSNASTVDFDAAVVSQQQPPPQHEGSGMCVETPTQGEQGGAQKQQQQQQQPSKEGEERPGAARQQYVSPVRGAATAAAVPQATRRSRREPQPKRRIEIGEEAPLLKWEKELQKKRGLAKGGGGDQDKAPSGGQKRQKTATQAARAEAPVSPPPSMGSSDTFLPVYDTDGDDRLHALHAPSRAPPPPPPPPPPKNAIAGLLSRTGHGGSLLSGAFSDENLLGDATTASLLFSAASPLHSAAARI